jgi:hypothetical protein
VVTAVGTDSLTLLTDSATKTIATNDATTYAETGTPAKVSGVAKGESVAVTLDPATSTPTAERVIVVLDRESGKVVSETGSLITLAGGRGGDRTVSVSAGTDYFQGTTQVSGVSSGEYVTAFGTRSSTASTAIDALYVDIRPATTPRPGPVPVSPSTPIPAPPRGGPGPVRPVTPGGPNPMTPGGPNPVSPGTPSRFDSPSAPSTVGNVPRRGGPEGGSQGFRPGR